jgi:Ca2+-binding RTX toxin-like protein
MSRGFAVPRHRAHPGDSRARRGRLVAISAAATLALVPASAAAKVIVGTAGPDHLSGHDPAGDLIVGGGGSDTLIGGPGNDQIYGVRSGNTIDGGAGDNSIEGGTGDDKITAGNGANTIYGGTGHDSITAGDGNNYVDPGGAPDVVHLGNGNNVVNGGSGGLTLTVGGGNNTVYLLSGPDEVELGSGVNHVYAAQLNFAKVDCGGNPGSVLSINAKADPTGKQTSGAVAAGKIKGCATIDTFTGPRPVKSITAGAWEHFNLVGDEGPDKLFGGHGGGSIDGGGGDNVLWADSSHDNGGARAKTKTTTITAANGNNIVYGGHGTSIIRLGSGRNFIRGGDGSNSITVGAGQNTIRLQGKGRNTVTINGGTAYVESFANGSKPTIRCNDGAKGIIVYGVVKPKSNCPTQAKAKSAKGKVLQVNGLAPIPDSDPVIVPQLQPGAGAGVARPGPRG